MRRRLILAYVPVVLINAKLWFSSQTSSALADVSSPYMAPLPPKDTEIGAMTTTHFNLDEQLTPHFKLGEFACACGGKNKGCRLVIPDQAKILANKLEIVRTHFFPHGLVITDSYRCPIHNKQVGGVSNSQHELGKAADIPGTVDYTEIIKLKLFSGVGWNRSDHKVVHVDIRSGNSVSQPATWTYPLD